MQNFIKAQALAIAITASALMLTALPASAKKYVIIDQPVVISHDYFDGPSFVSEPAYVVPSRPFSLHRFVGNAGKAVLGGGHHVMYGPSYDYWY